MGGHGDGPRQYPRWWREQLESDWTDRLIKVEVYSHAFYRLKVDPVRDSE